MLLGMGISGVVCDIAWRLHMNIGQLKGTVIVKGVLRCPLHFSFFCSSHAIERTDLGQG